VDLRRALGRRFHRLDAAIVFLTVGEGSRTRSRRRPRNADRGGRLKTGGGVDGAGLEVGATVAPAAAGRRRPAGRTSPVLDALRLRLIG